MAIKKAVAGKAVKAGVAVAPTGDKIEVELAVGSSYTFGGFRYEKGKVYRVGKPLYDALTELTTEQDVDIFRAPRKAKVAKTEALDAQAKAALKAGIEVVTGNEGGDGEEGDGEEGDGEGGEGSDESTAGAVPV